MNLEFVEYSAVAGQRVVHALQGGGPGLQGQYVAGETWCGVEMRAPGLELAPTRRRPTCRLCLASRARGMKGGRRGRA